MNGKPTCYTCAVEAVKKAMLPDMSTYTLRANGLETKPFTSRYDAIKFGQAWLGKFSIFQEILLFKDGKLDEVIAHNTQS